jgi:hypothetical protein
VSRRRPRAFDAVTRSAAALPRGHGGPVDYFDWRAVAALDIDCNGRPGEEPHRLCRYEIDEEQLLTQRVNANRAVHRVPDSASLTVEHVCSQCGSTYNLPTEAIRAVLAHLAASGQRELRLSASRVSAVL